MVVGRGYKGGLVRELAGHGTLEAFKRRLDLVLLNNLLKLAHQEAILLQLVIDVALFLWIVTVVDCNLILLRIRF